MKKIIVGLLILATVTPVFAYYTTTTSNGFKSNLRMNQPRTQIIGHTAAPRYYRHPMYYHPQKINQKRSLMRRISNYFQGVPTGFTPSVTPDLRAPQISTSILMYILMKRNLVMVPNSP